MFIGAQYFLETQVNILEGFIYNYSFYGIIQPKFNTLKIKIACINRQLWSKLSSCFQLEPNHKPFLILAKPLKPIENFITVEPYYEPIANEIEIFEAAYRNKLPISLKGSTGFGKLASWNTWRGA